MPQSNNLNILTTIFRYIESVILLTFFCFFLFVVINYQSLCLTSDCIPENLNFFGVRNNIYNLTLALIIPLFSIIGVARILINVAINKTGKIRPAGFIIGLILVIICHFIFAQYSKEFIYIYSTKNIISESPIVTTQIFLLLVSVLLTFGNKIIWDQSSFFVKSRLVFYFLNLLVLLLNINYGILFFIVMIPGLAITDIMNAPHMLRKS